MRRARVRTRSAGASRLRVWRRVLWLPLLVFGASLACSAPVAVSSDAPADVRWVAIVQEGEPRVTSPLARWDGAALPLVVRDDVEALVLGYSDPQVAAVSGGASPAQVTREALVEAAVCAPALPIPLWSARWSGEGLTTPVAPASTPRLTASWIDASCPATRELWVDTDCADVRCVVGLERRGCTLALDLDSCGLGRPRAVASAADLCLDFSGTGWECVAQSAPASAVASTACRSAERRCNLTWYREPGPPEAMLRRVSLGAGAPWRSVRAEVPGAVSADILARGYAWDLAPLGRGALVSSPSGSPREQCDPAEGGVLHVLDGDTGRVVRTATAPPCLVRLTAGPRGDVALGVYADQGEWMLGRFDREGRQRGRAPVDPRSRGAVGPPRPDVDSWIPQALVRRPGGWVSLWRARFGADSLLLRYDEALSAVTYTEVPDTWVTHLWVEDDDRATLGTNESGELLDADLRTGVVARRVRLDSRSLRPAVTSYDALRVGGELLVTTGQPAALWVVSGDRVLAESLVYDAEASPHWIVPLPWAPERVLVASVTAERSAAWSVYVPAERRFLPGTRALGAGVPARAVADLHERVWVLLAWAGEVVVLSRP